MSRVVATVGAIPGAGATTVVAGLGSALAEQRHHVALVDASSEGSRIADVLSLDGGGSVADALRRGVDLADVQASGPHGLTAFPAAPDTNWAALRPGAVASTYDALRQRYELVLVDCGSAITPAAAAWLGYADEIVVVTDPDCPEPVEDVAGLAAAFDAPVRGVVANRVVRDELDAARTDLAATGQDVLAVLPEDPAVGAAADAGRSLLMEAPDSPIASCLWEFAGRTSDGDHDEPVVPEPWTRAAGSAAGGASAGAQSDGAAGGDAPDVGDTADSASAVDDTADAASGDSAPADGAPDVDAASGDDTTAAADDATSAADPATSATDAGAPPVDADGGTTAAPATTSDDADDPDETGSVDAAGDDEAGHDASAVDASGDDTTDAGSTDDADAFEFSASDDGASDGGFGTSESDDDFGADEPDDDFGATESDGGFGATQSDDFGTGESDGGFGVAGDDVDASESGLDAGDSSLDDVGGDGFGATSESADDAATDDATADSATSDDATVGDGTADDATAAAAPGDGASDDTAPDEDADISDEEIEAVFKETMERVKEEQEREGEDEDDSVLGEFMGD